MNNENDLTGGSHTRPSRLYLPKLQCPPATIFEHLLGYFPHVHPSTWRARVSRGLVTYRDEEILVADKPHGMPVTPAGQHVERSLLVGLQGSTGLATLAAMHRLDRDTGGLLLLAIKPAARVRYHRLFADALIEREYLAVAHINDAPNRK